MADNNQIIACVKDELKMEGDALAVCEAKELKEAIPKKLIPSMALDISPSQNGKLYKVTICSGDDDQENFHIFHPRRGALTTINYRLWLIEDPEKSTINSSSVEGPKGDNKGTVKFNIGRNQLAKMVDLGVRSMSRKGEKIMIFSHGDYGFGRKLVEEGEETSSIPEGSYVGGEIELLEIVGAGKIEGADGLKWEVSQVEWGDDGDLASSRLSTTSNMFVRVEGWKEDNGGKKKKVIVENQIISYMPCWNEWGWRGGKAWEEIPEEIGNEMWWMREGDKVRWMKEQEGETTVFEVKLEEIEDVVDSFFLSLEDKVKVAAENMNKAMEYWRRGWWEAVGFKLEGVRVYMVETKGMPKPLPEEVKKFEGAAKLMEPKAVPKELERKIDDLMFQALVKLVELEEKVPGIMEQGKALDYANDAVGIAERMEPGMDFEGMGKAEGWRVRGDLLMRMGAWGLAEKDFRMVVKVIEEKLEGMHFEGGKNEKSVEGKDLMELELIHQFKKMKMQYEGEADNARDMA